MKGISCIFLLLMSLHTFGHKVLTMVYTTGMTVEGQIAFSDGSFAPKDTPVQVFEAEKPASEIRVGDFGAFVYEAAAPANYRFYVDMGAGHIATMTVSAEDFSAFADKSQMLDSPKNTQITSATTLEAVVAKQIRPLREEIFALKEKRYWMDILGGIGFILGIFGIAAWMQSRKYAKPPA